MHEKEQLSFNGDSDYPKGCNAMTLIAQRTSETQEIVMHLTI